MDKALVIIPTYNEVENIARLVREVLAQRSPDIEFEVLVVDDSSQDGTADAVRETQRENDRAHLLERPAKLGLGTAYIAGFRYAMEKGYPFVATMDADFSHDPSYLPAFAKAIADADLVIGSRYVPGGGVRHWGLHRKILSAGANLLAHLVAGLKPKDCTTGYRLYRTDLLRKIDLDRVTSHGYSCLMELVFVCQRAGARIVESSIVFVDRREGQSKISRKEIFKAFGTLYRLGRRRFSGR
ncbi:polyprenol monophosphomannose synthase [bacterium]|nr:polyprenol monophosphomannose synthase [bacterium]